MKLPPPTLTCHFTVGAGLPLAAAVKLACCPIVIVWSPGLVPTDGAVLTVRVAALVVALLAELVKTAWNWRPFSVALTTNV